MITILTNDEINEIKNNLSVKMLSNRWQKGYLAFLSLHVELMNKISLFVYENPEYESVKNVLQLILEDRDLNVCRCCGNKIKFSDSKYSYSTHFCKKEECLKKKQEIINIIRRENTFTKYGVHHTSARQEVIQKQKETYILRHPKKPKEIVKKIRKSRKNGYTFTFSKEALKSKKENQQITCLEKYGVKSNLLIPELVEHRRKEKHKFYYFTQIPKWKDYIIPMFSFEEYNGHTHKQVYSWKCVKCGTIFSSRIWKTHICEEFEYMPRCLKCFPYRGSNGRISMAESTIFKICQQIYPNTIHNDKKLINPLELDILIPEIKLAIEYNGLFWHSSTFKDKDYHLNKTNLCEQLGYRLIHIWEDEWNNDKEKIMSKLENILNNTEEIATNSKELILDRCWHSKNTIINGFKLVEITEPELMKNNCYNCGKLIYRKIEEDIKK